MTNHLTMPVYFYDEHNYKIGPISKKELIALAADGTIKPETRITNNTIEVKAKNIPKLKFGKAAEESSDSISYEDVELMNNQPTKNENETFSQDEIGLLLNKFRQTLPPTKEPIKHAHSHVPTKDTKIINTLVTPTEKKFKEYLQKHLPENIEIHCKVRFADILHPKVYKTLNIWKHKKYFMMHVDFTLVNAKSQEIILAIELDDDSHKKKKSKENDEIKNAALAGSKVFYARVPVNKMYDAIIIEKIVRFCKKKTA